MADEDPRDVLRSIAYGSDPRVSPGDRVRAIEQLQGFPTPASEREQVSPELALEEVESLASAMDGFLVCARIAAGLEPDVKPPDDPADLREVVTLQAELIDRLEERLAERERSLAHERRHRLLPPAPPPVEVLA